MDIYDDTGTSVLSAPLIAPTDIPLYDFTSNWYSVGGGSQQTVNALSRPANSPARFVIKLISIPTGLVSAGDFYMDQIVVQFTTTGVGEIFHDYNACKGSGARTNQVGLVF